MLWAPEDPRDDQRGQVRVQFQRFAGTRLGGGPFQPGNFGAHGHPDVAGVPERRGVEGDGHIFGQHRANTVGEAGTRVGLVDHNGDPPPPGSQVHGRAHVPANAHEHVCAVFVQDPAGLPYGPGQSAGEPDQVHGGFARQRHPVDRGKVQAGRRHQAGLHAGRCPDGKEAGFRRGGPDGSGDGKQRADVACRSAAGEDDGEVLGSHLVLGTLSGGFLRAGGSAGGPVAELQHPLGPD